ncbi:MAG: methyltransferase domain-containing protein [Actinomycetota bacterium]|nr:methyltransferase domain-containing protein [Actinomycetota bacterium]
MLEDVVPTLICPHCGAELRTNGASLLCSSGHTANIARQGYVSLLGRDSGTHTADSAEMVAARERFLDSGHFGPLARELAAVAARPGLEDVEGSVLDLGTGTGYYLAAVLEELPGRAGLGVDNSKFAARRAARCHPRAGAIVADIWDEVPVRDESMALVLNVFAPRNGEEISRVLAPGGRLVVVTPGPEHLKELIEPFAMISVDADKEERLERSLEKVGGDAEVVSLEWKMSLTPEEITDLVGMGPSAGRLDPEGLRELVAGLPARSGVTGSVRISVL